jgi:hypothetical protein
VKSATVKVSPPRVDGLGGPSPVLRAVATDDFHAAVVAAQREIDAEERVAGLRRPNRRYVVRPTNIGSDDASNTANAHLDDRKEACTDIGARHAVARIGLKFKD